MRFASFLLCFLVACGNDDTSTPAPAKTTAETNEPGRDPDVPSAATGTRVFQQDAEAIAKELGRLEREGWPEAAADQVLFERDLRMKLEQIDNTLVAIDLAIRAESRLIVQKASAHNRSRQGRLLKEIDAVWREITEIRSVLRDKAKGTGEIPPGFTEDELKDTVADLEKKMLELKVDEKKIIEALEKQIALLESKEIPEQGETVLINEREVFRILRKRAQKLLQKS